MFKSPPPGAVTPPSQASAPAKKPAALAANAAAPGAPPAAAPAAVARAPSKKAAGGGGGAAAQQAGAGAQQAGAGGAPVLKKASDIAARMQSDENLRDIVESTDNTKLGEEEHDVLVAAEVDGEAEAEAMLSKHGVVAMTAAERELARWPNTHVLAPELVSSIVRRVASRLAPRVEFKDRREEEHQVEYLARGYQELLCTMLPDLLGLAKHASECSALKRGAEDAQPHAAEPAPASKARRTHVAPADLDAFCSVSRLLTPVVDVMIYESLEENGHCEPAAATATATARGV
jgi:hypothetical protein